MTHQQSRLLMAIFQHAFRQPRRVFFFPEGLSTIEIVDDADNQYTVKLNLQHTILVREREHYPDEIRCEVLGGFIGAGSFATVYKTLMTLIPLSNGSFDKKWIPRKVKRIRNDLEVSEEEVNREYLYSSKTSHTHDKRIMHHTRESVRESFLIGRLLPGRSLKELVDDEKAGIVYSTPFRWKCSRAACVAYLKQVAKLKVRHRDIKPGNVLLDNKNPAFPESFFIDYAFAEDADDLVNRHTGTLFYAAPEIRLGGDITAAVDNYALGVLLAELWNLVTDTDKAPPSRLTLQTRMQERFGKEKGFSIELCNGVANTIADLINLGHKKRCSVEDALISLEGLRLQYMQALVSAPLGAAIASEHRQAAALLRQLEGLFAAAHTPEWSVTSVVHAITASLSLCADQPSAVEEFLLTLGIIALQGARDCQAIANKAITVALEYVQARQERLALMQAFDAVKVKQAPLFHPRYQEYLSVLYEAVKRHETLIPRSFDEVVTLTNKAKKDIKRLERERDYIRDTDPHLLATVNPQRPLRSQHHPVPLWDLVTEMIAMQGRDAVQLDEERAAHHDEQRKTSVHALGRK